MARSSLLWIDRGEVDALLEATRVERGARPAPAADSRTADSRTAFSQTVDSRAAVSADAESRPVEADEPTTPRAMGLGALELPAGLGADDIADLARADFDRVGQRLIERLLAAPGIAGAFVADDDGLLLLGDDVDDSYAVMVAELVRTWANLRHQLGLELETAPVAVALGDGSWLAAVGVDTLGGHRRILAWLGVKRPTARG